MMEYTTITEVCKRTYEILKEHGYNPELSEGDERVDCLINGIPFAFYGADDDIFDYFCRFEFASKVSKEKQSTLTDEFFSEGAIAFESFYITEDFAELSAAFLIDMFEDSMITDTIDYLNSDDTVAAKFKAMMGERI
jgi:hypothetical protein